MTGCSSNRNVAGIYSLHFLENRSNKVYLGGGGAKHKTDSRRGLFALLICSFTTTSNGLFSTLHAGRKSRFSFTDLQKQILGNMFHRFLLLYQTRDFFPIKVPRAGRKQKISNSNLGRMRQNSVSVESLVPTRSNVGINSSSINQRSVTRR